MADHVVNLLHESTDLRVTALQNPEQIKVFRKSLADQINVQRMSQDPPKQCVDLTDFISDVIITTVAQGASFLEVHVIDPGWILLRRDQQGNSFFDVDESGYLWPPIDLNFPEGVSDAQWRLCQMRPSTDLTQANLILVFEDKVASVLREFSGPVMSHPNETRAEFIHRLVKEATVGGHMPSVSGQTPIIGQPDGKIRFIPLLPNLDFTKQDLTKDQQTKPKSASKGNRKNPNKQSTTPLPPAAQGGKGPPILGAGLSGAFATVVNSVDLSIQEGFSVVTNQQAPSGPVYIPPVP